jgi:hypothetical protein
LRPGLKSILLEIREIFKVGVGHLYPRLLKYISSALFELAAKGLLPNFLDGPISISAIIFISQNCIQPIENGSRGYRFSLHIKLFFIDSCAPVSRR